LGLFYFYFLFCKGTLLSVVRLIHIWIMTVML
jgi:hypothetical protein